MSEPRAGDKCSIHLLRFALIEEFPGEEPDLDEVLGGFAAHRCQRNVLDREGNYLRVPLCNEDVEETDDPTLFNQREWEPIKEYRHTPGRQNADSSKKVFLSSLIIEVTAGLRRAKI